MLRDDLVDDIIRLFSKCLFTLEYRNRNKYTMDASISQVTLQYEYPDVYNKNRGSYAGDYLRIIR